MSTVPAVSRVIRFTPTKAGNSWQGSDWTVTDEENLAQLIAGIAVGQSEHVSQILKGTNTLPLASAQHIHNAAIGLLTPKDPRDPSHRDGWLFQAISWIAAHLQDPASLKSAPQMAHALPGLDGLHLRFNIANGEVTTVTICEDKATTSPRKRIRDEVWPSFRRFESGDRDHELVSGTSALLAREKNVDVVRAVRRILWDRVRSYRVSITVCDRHNSAAGRVTLFSGYQELARGGGPQRRRAETFYQQELRSWMDQLAIKAVAAVRAIKSPDV